jgi:diaminopimelate decarboxylase
MSRTALISNRTARTAAHWPTTTRMTTAISPADAAIDPVDDLTVGGVRLSEIAARYGTPAYVIDEADVRSRCRDYRTAFAGDEVAYAAKAFLCRAMVRWVEEEKLSLDVCSGGELALARHLEFPPERIIMHGNAKTPADVRAAVEYGVGRMVLDSLTEINQLAVATSPGRPQQVLIRVTPGVDAHGHRAVTTGVEDQKFGFSLASGAAAEAVRRVLDHPTLVLAGLHCHIGSQITDIEAYELAARRMVGLMAAIRAEHGITVRELDLGGGHAVAYRPGDAGFDLHAGASALRSTVQDACAAHRLPVPRLIIEPGRAIVARSTVTLYRVLTVKRIPGIRTYVAVDGGMSDNPRPALYGARYTARMIGRTAEKPPEPMTVVGRHCEAGDVIAADVPLPADLRPGDLLAVPCTGAYHHSMASTYNQIGRPPVIAVRNGTARVLIRRETEEDLQRRDIGL